MSTTDNLTIARILTAAAERQVSDIHLMAANQPVVRKDGKLETLTQEPVLSPDLLQQAIDFLLPSDKKNLLLQQRTITVSYALGNKARFRVHVDFQKNLPSFDLRYISPQAYPCEQLGVPKRLVEYITAREGLLIIAGPRGSGRTTTMSSLLDRINHQTARHLVTLEDPIEYLLVNDKSLIKQRDIGDDVLTFAQALDDVRNEDADVLAIDVPIPPSAWPQVLNLAGSGTLVMVVVEADSTIQALEHIAGNILPNIDAKNFRMELADIFLAAACQRLVPRVGGGRLLVSELLISTEPVQALIRDNKILQLRTVLETSRGEGMISLERSLADLVRTGEVKTDEAIQQAADPSALQSMLRMR